MGLITRLVSASLKIDILTADNPGEELIVETTASDNNDSGGARHRLGGNNWTFAGSDGGGDRAAAILIETAKLNDIDPGAWLADVLARLSDHPAKRIYHHLPWNWRAAALAAA